MVFFRKKHKEDVKNSVGRLIFVGISVILQLLWIAIAIFRLNNHYMIISVITSALTIICVLNIFGRHTNATIKLSWVVLILTVPILGLILYLMSNKSNFINTMQRLFTGIEEVMFRYLPDNKDVQEKLEKKDKGIANQAYFIRQDAGFPVYQNTDIEFYRDAETGLAAQKNAIMEAKHHIFMEYHAIENSGAFDELKMILGQKAKEGVEVRVFYDDIGSVGFLNKSFIKEMEDLGIQCRVFNPIIPIVNLFMNNRDHRKITVIDGVVGFTGGYNLADEYFNITHPFGYWKDSGIKLTGDAVRTLTILFLEMWNAMDATDDVEDIEKYLPDSDYVAEEKEGYCVPYGDSPLDDVHTGEDVYMNLIKNAKDYIYIMTPYLIITDDMTRELGLAARRGVDVRIVTPGIPDKKLIYQATRSYYNNLARQGVRIYEYTPGFCHAKQVVSDDEIAVVGTINFDYRSLYHHFENAVLFYNYNCISDIKADMTDAFDKSEEVTSLYGYGRSTALRIGQCILRIIAPML